jgi:hypothetical protein
MCNKITVLFYNIPSSRCLDKIFRRNVNEWEGIWVIGDNMSNLFYIFTDDLEFSFASLIAPLCHI